ncbi:hypothetical protein Slala02_47220 [Streptomyces lavendulae subsp. lavendulae]|nr:hypothetical protein Slala01_51290 [Streptomyces lavendulae subsp. lavendulae]GLX28902.1 hypothetical protein Slala02_47220 [Streptomyces lavendulae subsp. lavendulae]
MPRAPAPCSASPYSVDSSNPAVTAWKKTPAVCKAAAIRMNVPTLVFCSGMVSPLLLHADGVPGTPRRLVMTTTQPPRM